MLGKKGFLYISYHTVVCIVLILFIYSGALAQQIVSIGESYGGPGSVVYIPVYLTEGTNIGGINASVRFSPDGILSDVSFVRGNLLGPHIADYNLVCSDEFRFIVYANPTTSFNPGSGTVGYIQAYINPLATPGTDITIHLESVTLSSTNGIRVSNLITADNVLHIVPAAFSFDGGSQGWQFTGMVNPYDEPGTTSQGGHLGLSANGSTYCFSYWYSPDVPIEDGNLYRVKWTVQSNVTDPEQCVQFRLRANQKGSWQSWERIVNSYNQQAPSWGTPKDYFLFLNPDVTGLNNDDQVIFSFDILSFDINDDEYSWLYLEEMIMEEVSVTSTTELLRYEFDSGAEGWQFAGEISPYDEPLSSDAGGHLALSPGGSVNCFSFWYSPDVAIQNGKTYLAQFELTSSVANEDDAVQFRTRINQKGSWQGWSRVVNSYNQQAPSDSIAKTYDVFFDVNVTGVTDNIATLSFDIMSFDPADNTNSVLYLESVILSQITISP